MQQLYSCSGTLLHVQHGVAHCYVSHMSYVACPQAAVIDPINYKANLTMPKLIIDATGDEFFQVQAGTRAGLHSTLTADRFYGARVFAFTTCCLLMRAEVLRAHSAPSPCSPCHATCRTTPSGGASCPARRCG